jgi:hypothetical protein
LFSRDKAESFGIEAMKEGKTPLSSLLLKSMATSALWRVVVNGNGGDCTDVKKLNERVSC